MKAFVYALLLAAAAAGAQDGTFRMTQNGLHDVIIALGENVSIFENVARFSYDGQKLMCISDTGADRMRIVAPIVSLEDVEAEQILLALQANFHTVLDARYAIMDDMMYAVYIHPLSPLTDNEIASAIRQVATAAKTFGTDYSSGELFFPSQRTQ